MAWNPNVPTVTNRVQDDLNAIRENFQHLDQLAERVDELQTVSELAPIANDLQTVSGLAPVANELQAVSGLAPVANDLQAVSGLAPVANELQTVSGLAPVANELQTVSGLAAITDDLQAVSGLAPYITALVSSRVVDHNLDVPNPANGWYVRWENGLQICWRVWSQSGLTPMIKSVQALTRYYVDITWTFPAAFVGQPAVAVGGNQIDASYRNVWQITTTGAAFACNGWSSFSSLDLIIALAVGMWK